jgi:hypothetical protein
MREIDYLGYGIAVTAASYAGVLGQADAWRPLLSVSRLGDGTRLAVPVVGIFPTKNAAVTAALVYARALIKNHMDGLLTPLSAQASTAQRKV